MKYYRENLKARPAGRRANSLVQYTTTSNEYLANESALAAVALGLVGLTVFSKNHSKDPKCSDPNTCHRKNR